MTVGALQRPFHFLFLQGPSSRFFDQVARGLRARGHKVSRINLHFGDRLFWSLPATDFRGTFDQWRSFVANFIDKNCITHIVFLGDRRPYHVVASDEANARGLEIICTDMGYLRPDWITLERDGTTASSRFPSEADRIRVLASGFPSPNLAPMFPTPFWQLAVNDLVYNAGAVLLGFLYPHYRRHTLYHPFHEYAGWLGRFVSSPLRRRRTRQAIETLSSSLEPFVLVPLQLSTDYQIRKNSPFPDMETALKTIIASYAHHGSKIYKLVIKIHPLDPGLTPWRRLVAEQTSLHRLHGRIVWLDGGDLPWLLAKAWGVVTVNSTVGISALQAGCRLFALGTAIYDVAGLTFQEDLDSFWAIAQPPDPTLVDEFIRALAELTQIKGDYITSKGRAAAAQKAVERLDQGLHWLPRRPDIVQAGADPK